MQSSALPKAWQINLNGKFNIFFAVAAYRSIKKLTIKFVFLLLYSLSNLNVIMNKHLLIYVCILTCLPVCIPIYV